MFLGIKFDCIELTIKCYVLGIDCQARWAMEIILEIHGDYLGPETLTIELQNDAVLLLIPSNVIEYVAIEIPVH